MSLRDTVARIVAETPAFDLHTHLFAPAFGDLLLRGIDDLLTYHYLVAETLRAEPRMSPETFFALPKSGQADHVWKTLFVERSPLSEATRGVVTVLHRMGLPTHPRALDELRAYFSELDADTHVDWCMQLAGVRKLVMTNIPFDPVEQAAFPDPMTDSRFACALRFDPLYERPIANPTERLEAEIERMQPLYMMVSVAPDFAYPGDGVLDEIILPLCRRHRLPLALMLGVRRAVNPRLGQAGDGVGIANLRALENLCRDHGDVKFLATVLSRENQYELNVLARKFPNLHPFGCWWFLNTPHLVEEMTRMRVELLGPTVTLQHSDARVLDQIIYKWDHSRAIIARVLAEKFEGLAASGWPVSEEEIRREAHAFLGGAFEEFLAR